MDPAVESSNAHRWMNCFLAVGQDTRDMWDCRSEPRTPNPLQPLVDKGIPHPYGKTYAGKDPVTQTAPTLPTRQQNLKGSKMLQFSFSVSLHRQVSKAQGHAPRGEKAPKLGWERGMGVQECSLAWRPGDPPGKYLWTQEDAGANSHITATLSNITVALWVTHYLQCGAKPLSSIRDSGEPLLPRKHGMSFHGQL